jgi:predicted kinase
MAAAGRLALILIGGFAGCGKTAVSRRLARDLGTSRLEADLMGKTIRRLDFFTGSSAEAYIIAYAALWRLCEEFLSSNVSVVVDANMAWDVAWESVDSLKGRCPAAAIIPVILQCPRDKCLARIKQRYVQEPGWHGDPARFQDAHATMLWDYLVRPDGAGRPVSRLQPRLGRGLRGSEAHVLASMSLEGLPG